MKRQDSFGGTSQFSIKSSYYDEMDTPDLLNDNPVVFYLKSKGKLPPRIGKTGNNNNNVQPGGKLLSIWNYPLRNKLWPIQFSDFHFKSQNFALTDERGQVYHIQWKEKEYESIKLASKPVSSIGFVQGVKNMLIIAYENGATVMMNTLTKEILCNIQLPAKTNNSRILFIRSHPKKPLVVFVSEENVVTLWNLELNQCTQTLECQERVVNIQFEMNGDIIAVILEKSGVFFYQTNTLDLLGELTGSEISAASSALLFWTSYVSIVHRKYIEEEDRYQIYLNVLLSGTDNRLYSYFVGIDVEEVEELAIYDRTVPIEQRTLARGGSGSFRSPMKGRKASFPSPVNPTSTARITTIKYSLTTCFFGYYELPGKFQSVVSSCYLGELTRSPLIGLLTSVGEFMILKSEGFQEKNPGFLTVISNVTADITQTDDFIEDPDQILRHQNSQYYPIQPIYGRLSHSHDHLIIIGNDGAARLFLINEMIGSGTLYLGKTLKAKIATIPKPLEPLARVDKGPAAGKEDEADYYDFYLDEGNSPDKENEQKDQMMSASGSFRHTKKSHAQHEARQTKEFKKKASERNLRSFSDHRSLEKQQAYEHILQHASRKDVEEDGRKKKTVKGSLKSPGKANVRGDSSPRKNPAMRSPSSFYSKISRQTTHASTVSKDTSSSNKFHSFITGNKKKKDVVSSGITPSLGSTHPHIKGVHLPNSSHQTLAMVASMPLFELATLTPKEKRVNFLKLKSFLAKNDLYPSRYRPLIWRFLLRLPENTVAFSHLVQRGVHPAYEDLYDHYPIPSQKLFQRLQNLCSQATHWAGILGDAPYLPALAFPFTLVYGSDELASLETVMTIMMYWGFSWHVTHPNPPMHFIDTFNSLLKLHELSLYQHFQKLSIIPGIYCWQLISTLFTEICNRNSWLQLMDYLFTYFTNLCNLILLPIAIMKDLKTILFSCDSINKIATIFHNQQVMNIHSILHSVQEMLKNTPEKYFVNVVTKYYSDKSYQLNGKKMVEELNYLAEEEEAKENLALANGQPRFPLLKGNYPVYDGYPEMIINLQMQERNKITLLSKEIRSRENILKQLQSRLEEIDKNHEEWKLRHKTSNEIEMKYHHNLLEKEKKYLSDLLLIEEEISETKIKTLNLLEDNMKNEVKMMDDMYKQQEEYLIENEKLLKEKIDMNYTLYKQRELSEKIEMNTNEKLRQLRMKRTREDWLKSVSSLMKNKEEELMSEDIFLQEKWKKQDEDRKLIRQQHEKQLDEREEMEKLQLFQEEVERRMKHLQNERQQKILELERARSIRIAKEQAEEALEAAERSALLLKKQELLDAASGPPASSRVGGPSNSLGPGIEEKLQETMKFIQHESNKLMDYEKIQAIKQSSARQQLRQAQMKHLTSEQLLASEQVYEEEQQQLQRQAEILQQVSNVTMLKPPAPTRRTFPQQETDDDDSLQQKRRVNFQTNDIASSQQRRSGGSNKPTWTREPSHVPAPTTDAGIGYGYGVKQPQVKQERRNNAPQFQSTSSIVNTARAATIDEDESVHAFSATKDLLLEDDDSQNRSYPMNDLRLPIDEAMERASRKLLSDEKSDLLESHHQLLEEKGRVGSSRLYPLQEEDVPKIPPTWNKSTAISSTVPIAPAPISPLTRGGSAAVMASSSSRLGELQTMWEESSSPKKLLYPRKSPSFIRREKEKAQQAATATSPKSTVPSATHVVSATTASSSSYKESAVSNVTTNTAAVTSEVTQTTPPALQMRFYESKIAGGEKKESSGGFDDESSESVSDVDFEELFIQKAGVTTAPIIQYEGNRKALSDLLDESDLSLNLATLGAVEGKKGGEERIEGGNLTDLDLTLESDG